MAKTYVYDCVYYWQGGAERGRWQMAAPLNGEDLYEFRRSIERMGYRCVYGRRDIGAPETVPEVLQ